MDEDDDHVVVVDETDKGTPPRKKLGRPRKVEQAADGVGAVPKKRGRPRKVVLVDDGQQNVQAPIKNPSQKSPGPKQPNKQEDEDGDDINSSSSHTDDTNSDEEETNDNQSPTPPPLPPKKRGRPRKIVVQDNPIPPPVDEGPTIPMVFSSECRLCDMPAAGASGYCLQHGGGRKCEVMRCMNPISMSTSRKCLVHTRGGRGGDRIAEANAPKPPKPKKVKMIDRPKPKASVEGEDDKQADEKPKKKRKKRVRDPNAIVPDLSVEVGQGTTTATTERDPTQTEQMIKLNTVLRSILETLMENEEYQDFARPIWLSWKSLKDYTSVIEKPICLETMLETQYESVPAFLADATLMRRNFEQYWKSKDVDVTRLSATVNLLVVELFRRVKDAGLETHGTAMKTVVDDI